MDRGIFAAIPFILACHLVGAGTFEGLEPGRSSRADADRVLGTPIREIVAGVRYDYDPSKYGARRISIKPTSTALSDSATRS